MATSYLLPFVSHTLPYGFPKEAVAMKPMSLLQTQEGGYEEKSQIIQKFSLSLEAKTETLTTFSEIKGKKPILFNFMGISENDQLQVSQVQGFQTKKHHESEEVSTELKLGYASCITEKRKASENPAKPSVSCGVKRMKHNKSHEVEEGDRNKDGSLDLKLGLDPWVIKKRIEKSDIGNLSRLLLAADLVKKHIFSSWDATRIEAIKNGVRVTIWDCDTNSEHQLLFKQWPSNGSYVIVEKWTKEFVKRRGLNKGDEIGLYWDQSNSRFNFSILKRALSN